MFYAMLNSKIKPIINYAYSLKEPVAIFPVEEFRNSNKLKTAKIFYPGLNKIKFKNNKKKTNLSLITTGTSISKCLNVINSLSKSYQSSRSLFIF